LGVGKICPVLPKADRGKEGFSASSCVIKVLFAESLTDQLRNSALGLPGANMQRLPQLIFEV